jgi:para-nitrobenzyl esterase
MPPVRPTSWTETRTALGYGPICPTDGQWTTDNDLIEFAFQHRRWYMNENCQNLNIWTPGINDTQKRPVMVWIHGGGFFNGSSIEQPGYDGENLCRKGNVVIVSVNHRLNVLGFLDLSAYGEKYKASANAGLEDLQMALQWIKENISTFGGDVNNITVFGQSGGGAKISCLMSAPSAKGLFQKAIVQSGSYLGSYQDKDVSRQIAAAMLAELHLQPIEVDSIQHIPYDRLIAAGNKAIKKVASSMQLAGKPGPASWGPSVDGLFLPYQPSDSAALDLSKAIPLLVGSTKNETAPFNPSLRKMTSEQLTTDLQKEYGDQYPTFITAVQTAWPAALTPYNLEQIDLRFRQGAIRQANLQASLHGAPVYNYLFAWQSPSNDGIYAAMHCMEIPFVFNNIGRCEEMTGGGPDAYALADLLSSAWINFARTGNPNTQGLPIWPAYTKENGATMIFDTKSSLRNHFDDGLLKIEIKN